MVLRRCIRGEIRASIVSNAGTDILSTCQKLRGSSRDNSLIKSDEAPNRLRLLIHLRTYILRRSLCCSLSRLGAFPFLTKAKLNAGVLNGPQIRRLIKDEEFPYLLSLEDVEAWIALCELTTDFLGNHRADDYETKVEAMLNGYKNMRINMSLKIHLLDTHLDFSTKSWFIERQNGRTLSARDQENGRTLSEL